MRYLKEAFDAPTLESAKNTCLSDDPNKPNKFKEETDALINVFKNFNIFSTNSKVLDYGCGIGRVSKEIINTFESNVIGLDQSSYMLKYAKEYVNNDKFKSYRYYKINKSIDICISILALQHSENPKNDIDIIYDNLKDDGYFILCNEPNRLIPTGITNNGYVIWGDDGINMESIISEKFKEINRSLEAGDLPVILYQKIL